MTGEDEDRVTWYITVEIVRCIGAISDSLRKGETTRLSKALLKLKKLDSVAVRSFSDDASMLISLLYQVAVSYGKATIYVPLRQLAGTDLGHRSRVEKLARNQFRRKKGILWTSQRQSLQKLIEQSSFALCTPTGSGKTLIANLALVKELMLRDNGVNGPLALYVVPSRALAGEVEFKLSAELGSDFIVTGLYGGSDWGITDFWLTAEQPTVLIVTVEKAEALMRYVGAVLLRRMRLLIIDEAHQVVPTDVVSSQADFADHTSRSLRLESFVSRLFRQAPDLVTIALTAVAGGAALPVARWVERRRDAEPVGLRYRSTRQIIGIFETAPDASGRMLLDLMNGRSLFVRGRDEAVFIRLRTQPIPALPARMRNSIYRFNELAVLWTALHLAEDGQRILISVAQQPEQTMGWFKEALELDAWAAAISFQPPENGADRDLFESARSACADYCGLASYESFLLDRGIATNHGQMPQRVRRLMVDLIDRGICKITVATATLTEGVNLPFDIIFVTSLRRRSFDPSIGGPVIVPISTAEFRNLSGRAGRPGASKGMEGITLIAVPARPATTAPTQLPIQRNQIRDLQRDYDNLRNSLLVEEAQIADVQSPLAILIDTLATQARDLLNVGPDDFADWLEAAILPDISEEAGHGSPAPEARLADTIDELDGVLLSGLEELAVSLDGPVTGAQAEGLLSALWNTTFTSYAAAQEGWLENAFVKRGRALVEDIYPDRNLRRKLYRYGFTPHVGRRFEMIEPGILDILRSAQGYGSAEPADRFQRFVELGELLASDRGFGFRARNTAADRALLQNWVAVLGWWLQRPDAVAPNPPALRSWQRFVSDNLDFRLGVAIGAAVASAWADGVEDPLTVPALATWRASTGLPWFAFWARELLRWGTLDPFVAFSMSRGLSPTREAAAARRREFEAWVAENHVEGDAERLIDPQLFLEWQSSLNVDNRLAGEENSIPATLRGTTGEKGVYSVVPIFSTRDAKWIDPAGYVLAISQRPNSSSIRRSAYHDDYQLHCEGQRIYVRRTRV